jgi:hypothetical protein
MKRTLIALFALSVTMWIPAPAHVGETSPYRVGAYYFGVYQTAESWDGIAGRFSQPALGWYNVTDPLVMQSHIAQAREAGLSFFNFYWYWRNGSEAYSQDAIRTFVAVTDGFRFMLSICEHAWDSLVILNGADSARAVRTIAVYTTHPAYLRLSDGRPVIEILDSRGIYRGDAYSTNLFITRLSREVYRQTGAVPYILINAELSFSREVYRADGYTCHAPFVEVHGEPYSRHLRDMETFYSWFNGKPFAPCLVTGFNETPRLGYAVQDTNAIRYFTDWTPQAFRAEIELIEQMMDNSPSEAGRILMVTTWNDHHEQTAIEPLVGNRERLDILSDTLGLR